jgi:hypothetical protein
MRLGGIVLATAALLTAPSVVLGQGPDMAEVVERSRATLCRAMAAELGVIEQACASFFDHHELRFMVVDLEVYEEMTWGTTSDEGSLLDGSPVSFRGDGPANTDPFRLDGGDYHVDVTTTDDCYYSFHLKGGRAGSRPSLIESGNVYDIEPGDYSWSVYTGAPPGCGWELTMEPLAAGRE